MYRLAIVLAIVLLPLMAVGENPDSRPSISIGVGGYSSWGEYSLQGINQDLSGRNFQLYLGTRIPISPNATFWGSFGYDNQQNEAKASFFYYRSTNTWNAVSFSGGITLYFGTSIND